MEEILQKGDTGPAVAALQALLSQAGFDTAEDGVYGDETEDRVLAFQQSRGLASTGTADSRTRALLTLLSKNDTDELFFYGDADRDGMLTAKDALLTVRSLLCPADKTGREMLDANGDGTVNAEDALFLLKCLFGREHVRPVREKTPLPAEEPSPAAETILRALKEETPLRHALVTEALSFAYDPLTEPVLPFPRSLYLWGANLYTEEKTLFCPAPADIALGALKRPGFFDGGRREMMLRALAQGGGKLSAADCSGGIVGLWRKFSLCAPAFDASSEELMRMGRRIEKEELRPGDLAGFPGHIGLYAGSGTVIEWAGGAFGCQITRLDKRQCWSFPEKRLVTLQKRFEVFTRPGCLP